MSDSFVQTVSLELGLKTGQIEATVALLADGGTVPFIARYRKEATGGLDEVQVLAVRDRLRELAELESRLTAILKSLDERGLLTPDLEKRLRAAGTMARLEDVYLPFRPKKRTRAMIAREKGLEPLALELLAQAAQADPQALALAAIGAGATAASADEALAGARDIIAETISEDEGARQAMRALFAEEAVVASSVRPGQEEKAQKYLDYFDFSEKLSSIPSHRFLAIRRAEAEGFLSVQALPDQEKALAILRGLFVKNASPSAAEVERALVDSYKRLISLSMETEARQAAKKKADLEAIGVFSRNLRELLMAPPLGEKAILAIDPGFRTGCKTVALSPDGSLLEHATVQPHASEGERRLAGRKILELVRGHGIEAIAVGNGTAGRETYSFVREIEGLPPGLTVELVNESGASIYSASEVAREEFPDLDLTIRGAVSIGRRLMDPLAELVKIDPKSIGVGQYQHDVDQSLLRDSLDDVVGSCVNKVGVEANTASEKLLSYVSGLGPSLAKNIVKYRREKGPFRKRAEFLKVPRLGPKAFEQCAGFLRLASAENPLDRSAVHPESYHVVESMASSLGVSVGDLIVRPETRKAIRPAEFVTETTGLPTIIDIISELEKPGRDPRQGFQPVVFSEGLGGLSSLTAGQRLSGVVVNVTAFGAFVDVGIHETGLVHLSELANRFVSRATEVVSVGQKVTVWVLSTDPQRGRLGLTMKGPPGKDRENGRDRRPPRPGREGQVGTAPKDRPGRGPEPSPDSPFAGLRKLLK